MFAIGLKSAGCNGLVFFGNMLNNVLHPDSGRLPVDKTLPLACTPPFLVSVTTPPTTTLVSVVTDA